MVEALSITQENCDAVPLPDQPHLLLSLEFLFTSDDGCRKQILALAFWRSAGGHAYMFSRTFQAGRFNIFIQEQHRFGPLAVGTLVETYQQAKALSIEVALPSGVL